MIHLGDFPVSHTAVCIPFDSFAASTGASSAVTNFANTDVQIYKDGGTTQRSSAAGIVVSTSFDGSTGLQMITIDLSDNTDAGFYAVGHEYQVAVADITIDAQTVRFWAATFSIERALGVLARIKAGTIKVDVDTIKTNPVVNGGTITFPTTATIASTTNITAGTITTVTNLTNAPTNGDLTAAMKTSVQTASDAAVTANTLVNAIAGYIDTEVGAIKAKTDQLTFTVANVIDANMLRTNGDATSAANVAKTTRAIVRCTVGAASSATSVTTSACSPAGVDADQFKGRIVTFDADTTTTGLRGQSTDITASSAAATPTLTVTALTQAPVSGDSFSIT